MEDQDQAQLPVLAYSLKSEKTHKPDQVLLTKIRMPDSKGQKPDTHNELEVMVRYIKDGMGRAGGRGYFLTIHGSTIDGPFRSCMLMQDPSEYVQIEPAGRFSKSGLDKAAKRVVDSKELCHQIDEIAKKAQVYYQNKTAF